MTQSFFAYHLTHFFGPFGMESYHTNSQKPAEGDLVYVVSGDNAEDGGKDYFLEGLFRIHRRWPGPFPLRSLRGDRREFSFRLSLIPVRMPPAPIAMKGQPWYERKEVHDFFSSGQNFNPVPAKYKERFDLLLVAHGAGADTLADDIGEVCRRTDVPATTREALVQARVGQGRFRADVTALWKKGEVCVLTGIDLPELLVASHIQPWRESTDEERLDPCNGLLLATHVDKAFDRWLLSFREDRGDYFISIHPRARSVFGRLGVSMASRLAVGHMTPGEERRFCLYMRAHYERHRELVARDSPTT